MFTLAIAAAAIDEEDIAEDLIDNMVLSVDDYQKLWASIVYPSSIGR